MLTHTPLCDFGWKAPDFRLKDTQGQHFTLSSLMGEAGLVVAFICNHCPYVQAIITRLVADAAILQAEGVAMAAIMPNDYQNYTDDAPDKMAEFAQLHGLNFPYLIDETQEVAKQWGAVCTPDFFGLNAKGELHYRGRLDNLKMADDSIRQADLVDAMRLIVNEGHGPTHQISSMGCSIKWRSV